MSRERSLQGGVGYSGAQVYILRWCKRGAFGCAGYGGLTVCGEQTVEGTDLTDCINTD